MKRSLPARMLAVVERRRSAAASTHGDRRTRRLRSRGAKRRAAIQDQE